VEIKVNKFRKERYWLLRGFRRERDYESGIIQLPNMPITKPSFTIKMINGEQIQKVVTTKNFIKNNGYSYKIK